MIEIGYQDLRFTVAETAAFLQMVTQLRVEQTTAALLEQKTEGWVTGLRLSALSLRHKGDLDHLLRNLPDNIHYVTEYLMSEVVLRRSPAVQEFLLKTAILDRFCTPLTDAVCAPGTDGPDELESGSQAILARLQQENLFVIPLDDQRHWFRYHHQFQELLLQRLHQTLTPEGITELHRRAGEWFAENNLIDEALRYTLAAGDISHVVHLVEQHRYDLMNTEQWQRLERWLKLLSPKTIEKNPMLLLTQAFIYEYRGQIAEAFAYRDQAEGLLSTLQPESLERKALEGEIAVLCAEQLILSGEGELAVESATRALELLPPEALHSWSYAIGDQVLANQMAGDIGRGLKIVNEILNKRASLPGMAEARMMLWFCIAYWMEGDLNGVKQSALRCLKLGEQHALPESIGFGRYFLGVSHYIRNELAEAERYLTAVVDDPFTIRPYYLIQSASALALIYTSQGRDEKASNVVESMISHTKETHDTLALATTQAFHVDLALRQGKALEARRLSEQAVYDLLPPLWFFYMPQLTPVRLLLAQNTPESLRQALTLLDPLDEYLAGINRKTIRVDVLALQALVLNAQGEEEKALAKLTESVSLARLGGFIRNFVDMGDPMANLLARLKSQSVAPDYIDQILAAFRTKDERQRTGPPPSSTVLRPSSPLIEPLSNRELEVLELLVRRLSDKEIGQHLFISTQTVKKHNARIFQKLSVKNRREAVAKAGALGILPND